MSHEKTNFFVYPKMVDIQTGKHVSFVLNDADDYRILMTTG
jgi:hypothetical protein